MPNRREVREVSEMCEIQQVKKGETIINFGDDPNGFYFIIYGKVVVEGQVLSVHPLKTIY